MFCSAEVVKEALAVSSILSKSIVLLTQFNDQVRSCACYAGSWSSIVPTFCRTDDLQDTRYFMELICSVPAEPLPMQILALAAMLAKQIR